MDRAMQDFRQYQESKSEGKARTFALMSLKELLEQPDPVYNDVVSDLLPAGGSSLLVAKPKVGKSTLAQQLSRSIAAGGNFLGRDVKQGTVIYLAFEEKASEVKKNYRLSGVDPLLPIYFYFGDPPDQQFNALRELIDEQAPRLVVVDTLGYWMGRAEFNDYGEVGAALRPLHILARDTTTHILCVHHAGKGNGRADSIDSPLGSTALAANVDTIIVLSEHEDDMRVLETRQRYGEHLPKTLLSFDKATRSFTGEGTMQDSRKRELEASIFAAIKQDGSTEIELREALKCDKARLLKTLDKMVQDGILQRSGAGLRGQPFKYHAIINEDPKSYDYDTF